MSAQPLQDAAADGLPPWLRELQGAPAPATGYGQPPAAYAPSHVAGGYQQQPGNLPPQAGFGQPPRSMQVGDLVSADDLPEWLRTVASGPLTAPAGPPVGNGNAGPGYPASPAGNGWAAQTGYGAGYGQPGAPAGAPYAPYPGNGAGPGGSGPLVSGPLSTGQMSFGQPASTLFDESALPDWLRQASMGQEIEGASPTHPAYGMPAGPGAYGAGAPGAGYNAYQAPPSPQAPFPRQQPSPQAPQAAQAAAFPSLDQAGSYRPAPPSDVGVSGRSLLDTGALPGWLGGQPGSAAPSPHGMPSNSGGISAQSLVDESALPNWLRAEPNTPAAPSTNGYGTRAAAGIPPAPAPAPQAMSGWQSASASAEPMPQWLNQVYADANVPRVEPRPAAGPTIGSPSGGLGMSGYGGNNAGTGMMSGNGLPGAAGGTVSASDFVDESALPDWLKSQGAVEESFSSAPPQQTYAPPGAPMRPATGGLPDGTVPEHRVAPTYRPTGEPTDEPPSRFAASDLIDPSALPSWVTAQNPAPEPTFNSATGWTVKQPVVPSPRQNDPMNAGAGYGAAVSRGDGTGGLRRGDLAESSWQNRSPVDGQYGGGGADAPQSGGRYLQQQRPYAPYEGEADGGYGRRMPDAAAHASGRGLGKRRGPPIPSHELPPWLHGTGSGQGYDDAYDDEGQMGQPGNDMGWADGGEAAHQWNEWDDEGIGGGNGYARQDEFAEYGYDEEPPREQRGGWRRFFGRK